MIFLFESSNEIQLFYSYDSYREVSIFFRYCYNFAYSLIHAFLIHVRSLKIIEYPESEIWLKKNLKKRFSMGFHMLLKNWPTFSIKVNKYFLQL